jgi:methionine--tRNA ligase beta chain
MRLLLIEDEPTLRESVAKKLRRSGYETDDCGDGETALELLAAERYDLVLLDLNLPKVDGMTVLRTLRKTDLETPVLILSARSEISDKVEGLDAGANDYLAKPFHLAELEALEAAQKAAAQAANAPAEEEKPAENAAASAELIGEHEAEISFDDFCKVELRVAEVRACERMKESKKLLHLTVFDGERERCILSGIAKWFAPEDLLGKKIGIVANLAPRPMMKGKYVSEGMIFAADTDVDGGCSIAFFPDNTPAGARIH